MTSERTSPVCVDIYCQPDSLPQQHSLGFFITSTDADDDEDSGCCVEDGKHSPQAGSDGSCDTGTGSSCSDDERADAAECDGAASQREVACYTHVVSHVQHSSPLKNCLKKDDELLAINAMKIMNWDHDAVLSQLRCQGIGKISLIVKRSSRWKQLCEVKIIVELSQAGDVTVNGTRQSCAADLIDKDVQLLKHKKVGQFHLMNGNGHYVIVLQHQIVVVQTLQDDTQPSTMYEFYGVEDDETKPYYTQIVVVLAFKSAETGFYFLCARDDNDVALQRCSVIRNDVRCLPTSTDSRFFYQTSVSDFRIFESTQLADHYLACDGQRLFLMQLSNYDRHDVQAGKFPELLFKFRDPRQLTRQEAKL